jgi:predicted CXXCH cytochrome family protein
MSEPTDARASTWLSRKTRREPYSVRGSSGSLSASGGAMRSVRTRSAATVGVLWVLAGCVRDDARSEGTSVPAASASTGSTAPASSLVEQSVNACVGTGAHDGHATAGVDCAVCHACAGGLAFGTITFPGGASTVGGTMTLAGGTTTCSVGCHSPLGAEPQTVAWNAGPLECTACHSNVATLEPSEMLSSHLAGAEVSSATCESCHDQSQHTSGEVRLVGGGAVTSGSCAGCHAGQGQTLGGETPPLLVGWSDAVAGDFHGPREGTCRFDRLDSAGVRTVGRGALPCPPDQPLPPNALRLTSRWWYVSGTSGPWAWTCDIETVDGSGNRIGAIRTAQPCPDGTYLNSGCNNPRYPERCYPTTLVTRGFGGSLSLPFTRGQDALPCASCHDFHASTNAFLLAATVNGVAIPAATIDRAGVGAEALCNACHEGERHEVCRTCHKEVWTTDGEYSWFEGAPVDPAPPGSACFYCHGHEGIRFMADSSPAYPASGHPFHMAGQSKSQPACSHCHSAWRPPTTEYQPPTLRTATAVSRINATSATVSWTTWEPATSYVEYGAGSAGLVAGDAAFATTHVVALSGLTPGTAYVWRVRSSDRFRNVLQTALQTFTTPAADAVPAPDLAPVYAGVEAGTFTAEIDLPWYPVTAPSGTAVEYEVQLASDPGFSWLLGGSLAGPGTPGSTVGDSGWVSGTPTTYGGQPALSTPATITGIPQDDCMDVVPDVFYWRVRARDQHGNVSEWSTPGTFGVIAVDPWC